MLSVSLFRNQPCRTGRRLGLPACCAAAALLGGAVCATPAAAGPKEETVPAGKQYQVYIGGREGGSYTLGREWGALRLSAPNRGDTLTAPSLNSAGAGTGVTYFTPSVSGVRVGLGFGGTPKAPAKDDATQYTDLGPRTAQGRDAAGRWQVGGSVAYSALELGANIGDHPDPTCTGGGCKTNDFWDVGVALRIGSGAISAGYTASQPRGPRVDETDRIDIYSLNAGYKVTPGLGIFGGVDWVDTRSQSDTQETPVDTRFMLGTNLKF
jgi:predicted porin